MCTFDKAPLHGGVGIDVPAELVHHNVLSQGLGIAQTLQHNNNSVDLFTHTSQDSC